MPNQKFNKFVSLQGNVLDQMIYDFGVPNHIKSRYYPTFDTWNTKSVTTQSFYKYHLNFMMNTGLMMVGATQWIENCNDYCIIDDKKAALLKLKYEL
jgi:hypothetical protein